MKIELKYNIFFIKYQHKTKNDVIIIAKNTHESTCWADSNEMHFPQAASAESCTSAERSENFCGPQPHVSNQRTLTYFVRGKITVWLTSCLTGKDLAQQANLFIVSIQQNS